MNQNNLFSFFLFLTFTIIFIFALANSPFMHKTISGDFYGRMDTLNSKELPFILSEFLKQKHSQYALYKIPNYIEELFRYNKDFYPIYHSGNKKTVLLIATSDDEKAQNKSNFYLKLRSEVKFYPKDYNFINLPADKHYNIETYRYAYNELVINCRYLCIIDPVKNTMFSLKNAADSDVKTLEVIFQQYALSMQN